MQFKVHCFFGIPNSPNHDRCLRSFELELSSSTFHHCEYRYGISITYVKMQFCRPMHEPHKPQFFKNREKVINRSLLLPFISKG